MTYIWARTIVRHRIDQSETVPLEDGEVMEALSALCVWGVSSFRRLETKGRRVLRAAALIAAAGVAANIAYLNLFMFWTA